MRTHPISTYSQTFNADGTTTEFPVPFDYVDRADVLVYLNASPQDYSWTSAGRIKLPTLPAAGSTVYVTRRTAVQLGDVAFDVGRPSNADLTRAFRKVLYTAQDALDRVTASIGRSISGAWDALGFRVSNLADPILDGDAASRGWVLRAIAGFAANAVANTIDRQRLTFLGFVGDGKGTTLRSTASCAGYNTTAWTLAQWRNVHPTALSLDDYIDGLALQTAYDALKGTVSTAGTGAYAGTAVFRPGPCIAQLSRPLVTNTLGVDFEGEGKYATVLVQMTTGADGWRHNCPNGVPSSEPYASTFRFAEAAMRCVLAGGSPFKIALHPVYAEFVMADAYVGGYGDFTNSYWADGGHYWGCSTTRWSRVNSIGRFGAPVVGNGPSFEHIPMFGGQQLGNFVMDFNNVLINGWVTGISFKCDDMFGIEGVTMTQVVVGSCVHGVYVEASKPGSYNPPWWAFTQMEIEVIGSAFILKGIRDFRITDTKTFVNPQAAGFVDPAVYALGTKADHVSMENCSLGIIDGLSVEALASSYAHALVAFGNGCRQIRFTKGTFQYDDGCNVELGFGNAAGNVFIVEMDYTFFVGNTSGKTHVFNASTDGSNKFLSA